MFERKTFGVLGLMVFLGLGIVSVPRTAEGQGSAPLQRVLDVLHSFGDLTRSWSAALPASERFVVLAAFNNEAVLDRNTGLVWEQRPQHDFRFWASAQYECLNARTGGQMGWRMPSISELTSLMDPSRTNPALPADAPFDIGGQAFFWTTTRRALFTDLSWGVNIRDGFVDDYEFSLKASAWCVRGGTNSDEH